MKLQYNLENIGNIDKASITIKPLTIIAGENSSGKTFVTKSLYTILSHVQKDVFQKEIFHLYMTLLREIREYMLDEIEESKIQKEIDIYLAKFNIEYWIDLNLIINEHVFLEFEKILNPIFNNKLPPQIDKLLKDFFYMLKNQDEIVLTVLNKKLDEAFKKNFQITNLKFLIKDSNNQDIKLNIENICEVIINDSLKVFLDKKREELKKINNVVFFDSPVYIKIRKALEKKPLPRFNYNGSQDENKYLKGYPEYIDDLYHDLDLEYIDTADFDEISQEIQKIISGKLDVARSGDINYTDNKNNTIPLSLTAMGISNIGLIDLLLRNNVINKGSFLIMDEPEVHLHPEWQVILAKLLYKIAKGGANIIIATHSLDFLKAFENILKEENEIAEEIISINKMPYDESFAEKTELEKVGIVLDDLSRPFYDLYMQDI